MTDDGYRWVAAPTESLLARAEICSTREAAIEAARQEHGDVDLQVMRVEMIAPEYYAPDAGHVIEYRILDRKAWISEEKPELVPAKEEVGNG